MSHYYCRYNYVLCLVLNAVVGFEITAEDTKDILFGNTNLTALEIASKAFIQFEDVSAKFAVSASVSGSLDLAGVATINVDDGSLAFALGLGLDQASDKLYFNELKSTILALRQGSLRQPASWRKVGVLDASLEISFDPNFGSDDFAQVLGTLDDPSLVISVTDDDLFGSDAPKFSIDFDLE